ncbi:MAG: hypothetical protein C5B55_08275 [Blastocatellia bacterium]|nr:MAG: hypothetical protein C5B55_08275 [Blastocatellia bacterium]
MCLINISAGEAFELLRPAALVGSAILSTFVFASASRRFALITSILLGIVTLALPLIAAPLYFAFVIVNSKFTPRNIRRRWLISASYAGILLGLIFVYLKLDQGRVDVHLWKANQARLNYDRNGTIREYRAALSLEDNPHTHKLLAIELTDAGNLQDAINEFRLAERGGEPDDSIHLRLGELLDKTGNRTDALGEYEKYLKTKTCLETPAGGNCVEAVKRLSNR